MLAVIALLLFALLLCSEVGRAIVYVTLCAALWCAGMYAALLLWPMVH